MLGEKKVPHLWELIYNISINLCKSVWFKPLIVKSSNKRCLSEVTNKNPFFPHKITNIFSYIYSFFFFFNALASFSLNDNFNPIISWTVPCVSATPQAGGPTADKEKQSLLESAVKFFQVSEGPQKIAPSG